MPGADEIEVGNEEGVDAHRLQRDENAVGPPPRRCRVGAVVHRLAAERREHRATAVRKIIRVGGVGRHHVEDVGGAQPVGGQEERKARLERSSSGEHLGHTTAIVRARARVEPLANVQREAVDSHGLRHDDLLLGRSDPATRSREAAADHVVGEDLLFRQRARGEREERFGLGHELGCREGDGGLGDDPQRERRAGISAAAVRERARVGGVRHPRITAGACHGRRPTPRGHRRWPRSYRTHPSCSSRYTRTRAARSRGRSGLALHATRAGGRFVAWTSFCCEARARPGYYRPPRRDERQRGAAFASKQSFY